MLDVEAKDLSFGALALNNPHQGSKKDPHWYNPILANPWQRGCDPIKMYHGDPPPPNEVN